MANSKFKRYIHATIGFLFVIVAAIGAVLPGIPTVGPLMLASFFLLKSSPALEKRLVRNRFFGKYLAHLDGNWRYQVLADRNSSDRGTDRDHFHLALPERIRTRDRQLAE